MEKLISTVLGVVIAVGVSAVLFIGANKWFDQSRKHWRRFGALTGAMLGLFLTAILVGNRVVAWKPSGDVGADLTIWLVAIGLVVGGLYGFFLSGTTGRLRRLLIGAGGGTALGAAIGVFLKTETFPAMQIVPLIAAPAVGAVVWGAVAALRRRNLVRGAITGATLGWVVGAFGFPALGTGTRAEVMMGTAILGLGVGARLAMSDPPSPQAREALHVRSRAWIFLGPALAFIAIALVIPAIRTFYLSFLDRRGAEAVGFANYKAVFLDPNAVDLSGWADIFRSSLTWWALGLAALGIIAGIMSGRRTGRSFESNGASLTPIGVAIFLAAFAIFSSLRGTIFNNLWWVFTVTLLAAGIGLAVAVLADRSSLESAAKSIIFMPMAISFVGASIIWRFVYIARPPQKDQTGLLNGLWVGIGRLSNSSIGSTIAAAILGLFVAWLAFVAYRGYRAGSNSLAAGSVVGALPFAWLIYRFLGPGVGGFEVGPNGDIIPKTILFIQEAPFNNVWLMVVLIWIQTGFAMVIFSAAIKAVPSELIEASRVDGATESQTFWRVTVPQIAPTIGVVVTTLIVTVMKVFDIVKVMTNGNFDTQVIANLMWTRAFGEFNIGLGSALAVVLFVSVLPVMFINIRRMQKEAR